MITTIVLILTAIFILLLIKQFEISFTTHQKVLYLCYKTYEKNQIEFGFRETVKCIKIWHF